MEDHDEIKENDVTGESGRVEMTTTLVAAERAVRGIDEMERLLPRLDELTKEDQTEQIKSFDAFIEPINKALDEMKRGNYPFGQRRRMTRQYMDAIVRHQDVWLQIVEKVGIRQVDVVVDLMCGHGLRVREQVDTISIQRFMDQMLRHLRAFRQRMSVLKQEIESDPLLDDEDKLESYREIIQTKEAEKKRIGEVMKDYGIASAQILEKTVMRK